MIVYVESNFVLELALLQEQAKSCDEILALAEAGRINLILPAFSVAEPYQTLSRRHFDRRKLSESLNRELTLIKRSEPYRDQLAEIPGLDRLLIRTIEEEASRLDSIFEKVLKISSVIQLTAATIDAGIQARDKFGLSSQDAVVFASVLEDLQSRKPASCAFLNRNSKDFNDPDIDAKLKSLNCKLFLNFDRALEFLRATVGSPG